MSQQTIINGHCLRHFNDISTLGIQPISLDICCKIPDIAKILDKTDKPMKINHDCLSQSLKKKNGFFLNNFLYLGLVICLMSRASNINNYQALRNQLISMHQNILNKIVELHKQEGNQIGFDPNHSSLKYLNLPSKRVMILKHNKKNCSCKVCLRGVELINYRLSVKYGCNSCLKTMHQLTQIESLSSISQQWILNKKKFILESVNLENIDDNKYNFENYSSHQAYTYDELLHDMNIIGQLKNFGCPFHVSNKFLQLAMIVNASNIYRTRRLTNVSDQCDFIYLLFSTSVYFELLQL